MPADSFAATTASTTTASTTTAPAPPPDASGGPSPRRRLWPSVRPPSWLSLSWPIITVSLLVMLAVSVYLRTRQLHFFLWIDEGLSVGIAGHPLSHIPGLLRQDGSPPLYYLILHVWMSLRGRSEVATHELSLIFALLTVPAAFWAGASLFGRRVGLISAGIGAALPYLNTYAQETRMYALMALLSLIVAAAFVHAYVYRHRRYVPVFSLSLAAALYTHNWGLFLAAMSVLCFLWCLRREPGLRPELLRDGVIGFGLVALLFLPWLPTLLYQVRHTGAPWDLPPVLWSLTQGLYSMVGGRGAAMLILLAGGAGLLAIRAASPRVNAASEPSAPVARDAARLRIAAECLLILGAGTYLLAWAYSKHTPAWSYRYFAAIVGPMLLVVALGLSRGGRLAIVAMVLTAVFWILDPVTAHRFAKSNVALVAVQLRPHVTSNTVVLSTQPEQVPTLAYYLPQTHRFFTPLGAVRDPGVMDWRDALARLRRSSVHGVLAPMIDRLKPGARVLLVTPDNFPTAPEWQVLITTASVRWQYFLSHDPRLREIAYSNWHWYDTGISTQGWLYEVVR
ncbi:MAG TPA: glycosyltransferase family 39 protein [Solirubrobacteraceae bacterium]|nr:glycosyltransferase family 39 protein [Solirubrobacteraceae bacterium]